MIEVAIDIEPVRAPVCEGLKVVCSVQEADGASCPPEDGQSPASV